MNLAHAIEERIDAGLPVTEGWLDEMRKLLTPEVQAVPEKKYVAPKEEKPASVKADSVTPDSAGTVDSYSATSKPRAPKKVSGSRS